VPPLRERREDIPLLVEHFYRIFTGNDDAIAPDALVVPLREHAWPGNVRELRSAVERAVLMADPASWQEPAADAPVDPTAFDDQLSFREAKERSVARWERWYLGELLTRSAGSLSRAARAARMDRAHLRELLRKRGVKS